MSTSTPFIFKSFIYRERHCNDLIEFYGYYIFGVSGFCISVILKYFLRWEQGFEVGEDPLCLIAAGETFPSEFPPSMLFLRLGSVFPTYSAVWPASAPNLCYLHRIKQTHTFIHCSSGCLPRDRLGWDVFPCDILIYSCWLGKHLPVSFNWRLASPVCSNKNLLSRCIFLGLTLKCWVMSFTFRN